jgi:arylsulfatase A-like enzyme
MNVIWVISDTLRRDHLGCYGNQQIHTSSLDAFACRSVRFDRHYIASFPTMPARADYLTGRWTGSFMNWAPLPEDLVTLPKILQQKGFNTTAVVDTPFYLRNKMNYDRGFSTFFEVPGQGYKSDTRAAWRFESDRFAPRTFTKAMQWLERHYKEDFFLWVDAWDPHEPWDPPSFYTELYWPDYDGEVVMPAYAHWQNRPDLNLTEEKVKKAHACYCGEVTMVDTWFGYFLRRLENMGLMEKTAIIFTSDHGFYFGEHGGLFGKAIFAQRADGTVILRPRQQWTYSPLYEEVTAAPLLIYAPNIPPGVYSGLTSAIDLAPTVLDILGQGIPSSVEGQSLLPAMKDSSVAGREYVVSGPPFANVGEEVAWVDGWLRIMEKDSSATVTNNEWSLIYAVEPGLSELFYLSSDPKQEKNVINEHPEVARELHQQLVKFLRETNVPKLLLKPRLELR